MNIKKEHRDTSPDCIITSSQLKADRPSVFQTTPPVSVNYSNDFASLFAATCIKLIMQLHK